MTWASRVDPGASASSLQAAATPALPERADLLGPLQPNACLPYFTRHGFINTGNSCFANSTLQALLGCTSFHSLLLALRTHEERHGRLAPVYPTLRSLAELAGDFAPREDEPESSGAVHYGKKVPAVSCEHSLAAPLEQFEKSSSQLTVSTASPVKQRGRRIQQDAQEWLNFLLDAAHSELLALKAKVGTRLPDCEPAAAAGAGDNNDDESWVSVGRKNKTAVTRAHEALKTEQVTAISELFGGICSSIVTRRGATPSKTLEPFKMLTLDVSDVRVHSIADALQSFCKPEILDVFKDAHGVQTSASKMLRLERLPRILLLHLKLFSYTQAGEQKLPKQVAFTEQLTIERSVYEGRDARTYRLAAVVEHLGTKASNGHYVTYARDTAAGWLRFDDAVVQAVPLAEVLKRHPYILAYELL